MIVWTYQGIEVKEAPQKAKAFVYLLEFDDGTKYVGKKNLHSTRRKKVIGKKRKVVTTSESNWKTYNSSSQEVKTKLKSGDKLIKREIIRWCYTLGEATYWEAYWQFQWGVLLDSNWLNRWISVRLYKQNMKDTDDTDNTGQPSG